MNDRRINKELRTLLGYLAEAERTLDFAVYLVGGSVRRMLLEQETNDLDIVVDADAGAARLADQLVRLVPGASRPSSINDLPTFEVRTNGYTIHIADAARDGAADPATVYAPLSARMCSDALRRDFTVNTLLLPVAATSLDAIIDPLRLGIPDLQRRVLRTPLAPEVTIAADPIRLLRAVRFNVAEGFALEHNLPRVIRAMAGRIANEPGERVNMEFSRIITSPRPADAIRMMARLGLLKQIFPDVEHLSRITLPPEYADDDALSHTLKVLEASDPILRLRLAALFHDVGKAATVVLHEGRPTFPGHQYASSEKARTALQRLRYPNRLIEEVVKLVEMHMIAYRSEWSDTAVRRLVHNAGGLLDDLLLLYRADILSRTPPHNDLAIFQHLLERIKALDLEQIINARSPLSGDEVMALLQIKAGPRVGEVQEAVEQAIVDGRIPGTPEAARAFVLDEYGKRG